MVVAYLKDLGLSKFQSSGKNIMIGCPVAPYTDRHRSDVDKNPSMGVLVKLNEPCLVHCFSCGWRSGSLYGLVSFIADRRPELKELAERIRKFEEVDIGLSLENLPDYEEAQKKVDQKVFDEEKYDPFSRLYHSYLKSRGVTLDTAKIWESGHDLPNQRVVFPVRDRVGQLVGMVGRSTQKNPQIRYFNYWDFERELYLFGEHLIKPGTALVLVEGPFDAIMGYQALHKANMLMDYSVVAAFGVEVTDRQIEKLVAYGDEVILAFDNSTSGKKSQDAVLKRLEDRTAVQEIRWPDSMDKFDPAMAGDSFADLVDNATMAF